jgi:hypothetical protein
MEAVIFFLASLARKRFSVQQEIAPSFGYAQDHNFDYKYIIYL